AGDHHICPGPAPRVAHGRDGSTGEERCPVVLRGGDGTHPAGRRLGRMSGTRPEQARGMPAATAAIVGFFTAAVLPRATWPLIDGDVWWHIRAEEEVMRTGRIPNVDTWSIVGLGRPWTSQDWLANVLLAAGNALG